jgi:phage-related protein
VATQAVLYRDEKGREPVDEFLAALPEATEDAINRQIEDLNGLPDDAPPPGYPRTSQIEGPLRELRCHFGNRLYRIFYRRSRNLLILLHAVPKAERRIAPRDIELSRRRWREFKERMDSPDRRGPRPIGRDAP